MKELFSRRIIAITAAAVFLVSLFSWGIIWGNDTDDGEAGMSVTVLHRPIILNLEPLSIVFSCAGMEEPRSGYDRIMRGSTNIFADSAITATVQSDVAYLLNLCGTDLFHEEHNNPDPLPAIPVGNVEYSGNEGLSWEALTALPAPVVSEADPGDYSDGDEYVFDFVLRTVPADAETGLYAGALLFDAAVDL